MDPVHHLSSNPQISEERTGQSRSRAFSAVDRIADLPPLPASTHAAPSLLSRASTQVPFDLRLDEAAWREKMQTWHFEYVRRGMSVPEIASLYQLPYFIRNPTNQTPLHAICFALQKMIEDPESRMDPFWIIDLLNRHEWECHDRVLLQSLFVLLGQAAELGKLTTVVMNSELTTVERHHEWGRAFSLLVDRLCYQPQDSPAFAWSVIGVCKCASLMHLSVRRSLFSVALNRPALNDHYVSAYEWIFTAMAMHYGHPMPAKELVASMIIEAYKRGQNFSVYSIGMDCLLTMGDLSPAQRLHLVLESKLSFQSRQRLACLLKEAACPPVRPADPYGYEYQIVNSIIYVGRIAKESGLAPFTEEEIQGIQGLLVSLQRTCADSGHKYAMAIFKSISRLYDMHPIEQLKSLENSIATIMAQAILGAEGKDPLRWLWRDKPGGKILELLQNAEVSEKISEALLARLEMVANETQPVFAQLSHAFLLAGLLAINPCHQVNEKAMMRAFQAIAQEIAPEVRFEQLKDVIYFLIEQCDSRSLSQLGRKKSSYVRDFISGLGMMACKGLFQGFGPHQTLQLNQILKKLKREESADALFWMSKLAEQRKLPPSLAISDPGYHSGMPCDYWLECLLLLIDPYQWPSEKLTHLTDGIMALGRMVASGQPIQLTPQGIEYLKTILIDLLEMDSPDFSLETHFELLVAMRWLFNKGVLPSPADAHFIEASKQFILNLFEVCPDATDEQKMHCLLFLDSLAAPSVSEPAEHPLDHMELEEDRFGALVRRLRELRNHHISGVQISGNARIGIPRARKRKDPPQQ